MSKNKNGPLKEKPKPIQIGTIKRTRKAIQIHWTQGDSKFDLNERDNPLPAFNDALDALAPTVATILHLPDDWTKTSFRVVGLIMGEQGGAQTVSIMARKGLDDASKEFVFCTPPRLLAHPTEPGSYTPPLDVNDVSLVEEAVEQGKLYVRGERAQGQIAFEGDEDEGEGDGTPEPEAGQELPLHTEIADKPTKTARRRAK